nr:prepilin-type N-terminal cleavage/methylation domain-containing protein [uncultured Anaerobutyricum sp.]
MKKDNRGLTLIELIITVAIAMIFSGVILTFVAVAAKSYRRTSGGAQSQMEMQDALDQLENLAMNTNLSMFYAKGEKTTTTVNANDKIEKDSDIASPLNQTKTLFMGSKEETGESVYSVVIWNTDNGKLTFFKAGIKKGTGTGSLGTAEVIAENVTQFAADIHDVAEAHTVRFKLVTEVNGRKVEKTETVTLRNDIVIALPGTE